MKNLETLSAVVAAVSDILQLHRALKRALDEAMKVSQADKKVIHLFDAENQELFLHIQ